MASNHGISQDKQKGFLKVGQTFTSHICWSVTQRLLYLCEFLVGSMCKQLKTNTAQTAAFLSVCFPTNPAFCLVCLSLTVSACYKWMSSKLFAVQFSYATLNGFCAFLIFFYITPGTEKKQNSLYMKWINLYEQSLLMALFDEILLLIPMYVSVYWLSLL